MENLKSVVEAWINDKIRVIKLPAAFAAGFFAHWVIF